VVLGGDFLSNRSRRNHSNLDVSYPRKMMDKNYPSLDNPLWKNQTLKILLSKFPGYITAEETNIAKTFERIKRELKEKENKQ
jgi:hypothetical protein